MTDYTRIVRLLATSLLGILLFSLSSAVLPALSQDDPLLAGKRLYLDAACENCHGKNGQGGGGVDFPAGPSLRASALDRDSMILFVSCGVPGTRMPAWLKGAYTEAECYGDPVGPPPAGTLITGIFTAEEIGTLVDYIRHDFMHVTPDQP